MDNINQHHTTRKGSTYGRIAAESRIQPPTLPPEKLPRLPNRLPCPKCEGKMEWWNKNTKQIEECDLCCDFLGDATGYIENRDGDSTPETGQHD